MDLSQLNIRGVFFPNSKNCSTVKPITQQVCDFSFTGCIQEEGRQLLSGMLEFEFLY